MSNQSLLFIAERSLPILERRQVALLAGHGATGAWFSETLATAATTPDGEFAKAPNGMSVTGTPVLSINCRDNVLYWQAVAKRDGCGRADRYHVKTLGQHPATLDASQWRDVVWADIETSQAHLVAFDIGMFALPRHLVETTAAVDILKAARECAEATNCGLLLVNDLGAPHHDEPLHTGVDSVLELDHHYTADAEEVLRVLKAPGLKHPLSIELSCRRSPPPKSNPAALGAKLGHVAQSDWLATTSANAASVESANRDSGLSAGLCPQPS